MKKVVDRWARKEHAALRGLATGKTSGRRFVGLNASKRNEAKLFLTAMLPVLCVAPFVPKWAEASDFQRALMAVTGLWLATVVIAGGFLIFRSAIRIAKEGNR